MDDDVFAEVNILFEENLQLPCVQNEKEFGTSNYLGRDETETVDELRDVEIQYGGYNTRHDSAVEEDTIDKNIGEEPELELDEDGDELEDIVGRYEYEIEQGVASFVDERFKERQTIPDSSGDEEDEMDLKKRRMKGDKLALGSTFYSGYEFKEAMLEYALSKKRNIKQSRWDKSKLSFACGMNGKCKWRVYCSYDKPRQKWVLKTRYGYHSCTPNGKCRLLKSPVIAKLFLDKLRQKHDLMPAEIQELIHENWKITSTRNQCQRGRLLALKWLEKEYAEQFAHLRGYVEEIKGRNPESTAIVETTSNAAGKDVFTRFYVCFASLKNTWRGSCRPIIGLDGTFLKVAVKGVLLTAVGHDAKNQIYPLHGQSYNPKPLTIGYGSLNCSNLMKSGYRLIIAPPEPELPGRKKKKRQRKFPRIKGKHESPKKRKREIEKMPRKGRIIHCSRCGEEGHNAAGCLKHQLKKKKMAHDTAEAEVCTSSQGPEIIYLTQPTQPSD